MQFYRRHELALRVTTFLVFGSAISGAIGGFIAAGLLAISPIGTVDSWRKIFLVTFTISSVMSR
jgi:hypothetical protein